MKPSELLQLCREGIRARWTDQGHGPGPEAVCIYDVIEGFELPVGRTPWDDLAHCLWLLDQMESLLKDCRFARLGDQALFKKYHNWLGFVQGVMFVHGVFDLDQMRAQAEKCQPPAAEPCPMPALNHVKNCLYCAAGCKFPHPEQTPQL